MGGGGAARGASGLLPPCAPHLQRAATTQSEAARLLAGARDLEESIGVSLSARRFEVRRCCPNRCQGPRVLRRALARPWLAAPALVRPPLPSPPQVNRLELLLSIASFAAALGALVRRGRRAGGRQRRYALPPGALCWLFHH